MKRIAIRAICAGAFVLLSFYPRLLHALCAELNDRVQSLYSQADIVFVGTLVKRTVLSDEDENDTLDYQFTVKYWLKGGKKKRVRLQEGNDSGRTYYEVGKTYLVFSAKRSSNRQSKFKKVEGYLLGYGCADPNDFAFPGAEKKVKEARNAEEKAKKKEFASIRIRVLESGTRAPVTGCPFTVKGTGLLKEGKTDVDGWLWMDLPAGRYYIWSSGGDRVVTEHFDESGLNFEVKYGGGWDQMFYRWPKGDNSP